VSLEWALAIGGGVVWGKGTEVVGGILLRGQWVSDLLFFWLMVGVIQCFSLKLSSCSKLMWPNYYWRAHRTCYVLGPYRSYFVIKYIGQLEQNDNPKSAQ
jgi:hypothetical protein